MRLFNAPRHVILCCVGLTCLSIGLLYWPLTGRNAPSPTMASTKRPPALARLETLVGHWSGTSVSPPTQWRPEMTTSPLEATFQWILGRYHLEGKLRYTVDDSPFESLTLWSYDWTRKRYQVQWIDNFSSLSLTFEGTFVDDQTLLLTATRKQNAQIVHERLRFTFVAPEQWELLSESDVHGDFVVGITLRASRKW